MKKLMITKNLVLKTQNLVVNHESQPLKSNPKSILVTTDIVIIEMFWICHVISRDHKFKGLREFMGWTPSR